ncbi:hypothetical protein Pcinc_042504 [Petrolisthes cinctipes]|uniref:Uncharacterized protein n=1 Tax=Petrolisthes cinctipes TaxID=88211 RepID=A0AAE1BIN3_PETCI|nr:hypothetical protein Pcinc_042504 [Petrolisthes cinctipes]
MQTTSTRRVEGVSETRWQAYTGFITLLDQPSACFWRLPAWLAGQLWQDRRHRGGRNGTREGGEGKEEWEERGIGGTEGGEQGGGREGKEKRSGKKGG